MRSAFRSKWFSIDAFPGPVMKSTRLMPTRVSSSTTYCTTGLRPTGRISFGCDFVAGTRRVPRPATGTMAMSMFIMDDHIRELAEGIWRYHQLNHELSRADAILVLCSHDKAVAERG